MSMPPPLPDLIGSSPAFQDVLDHASALAQVDRPALIIGERGTGKELLASRLHFLSQRWDGPMIKVNCAAMAESLLESELFGHEAGAFTGATKRRPGRFERANGGTLFLDEIASASPRVQEKLLRVIEYGEFERIGGDTTLIADARIIAAANADLPALAVKGEFRADLLDRMSFDVLAAPPLRERREDILPLAAHFASGMATELEAAFPGFSQAASETLLNYSWPGNVREVKNVAERAMFHWVTNENEGQIEAVVLNPFPALAPMSEAKSITAANTANEAELEAPLSPMAPVAQTPIKDLRAHLDEQERAIVEKTLARLNGDRRAAASALALTYDQLRGVIRKHGLAS